MARLLTRLTLAAMSPTRPEAAKTASLPRDAPFPKRGRSERRGEEVRTALRVGRSPLQCISANGKVFLQCFRPPRGSSAMLSL